MITLALLFVANITGFIAEPGTSFREFTENGVAMIEVQDGVVWTELEPFRDGVVEADVFLQPGRGFTGLLFRAPDAENGELFYFRHHQRGLPDAWQYHPRYNGHQAYQIYQGQGFAGSFDTPIGRWSRVRFEVSNSAARILVDGQEAAIMHDLQMEPVAGKFGFWALGGERLIRNVSYKPLQAGEAAFLAARAGEGPESPALPGTVIDGWKVTAPLTFEAATSLIDEHVEDLQRMSPVHRGIVDLNQVGSISGDANSVLARVEIESPAAQTVYLDLAFSDDASVHLNGDHLFSGSDRFRSRDYRFLGTMGFYDRVPLRLNAGLNRLDIIVSEAEGGWGIGGLIEGGEGLVIGKADQ